MRTNNIIRDQKLIAATLGLLKVDVGVDLGHEIEKDGIIQALIEAKEIYNVTKPYQQKNWIILDLETGGRGWYPGCVTWGEVNFNLAEIKETGDESSKTLIKVQLGKKVKILSILDKLNNQEWYKVSYNNIIGYIKHNYISNITYTDN